MTARRTPVRLLVLLVLIVFAGLLSVGGAAAQDSEESLFGTIRDSERMPAEGVVITALRDGEPVGSARTDADGLWRIELPGPGTYDVEMDLNSLPVGEVPRVKGDERREGIRVVGGRNQAVPFALVAEEDQIDPDAEEILPGWLASLIPSGDRFLQVLVNGIQFGSIIAVCAVGLSLVFGTSKLINFAHGELVTLGAVIAFYLNVTVAAGIHLIPAALIAIACGALIGAGLERGLWRPLRSRGIGRVNVFIVSIGLAIFIRHIILIIHGSRRPSYTDYAVQARISIGPITTTPRDLTILALALITLLGIALILQKTRIGTAIRAVSDSRELASTAGINVNRVILIVWTAAGGLAAFGGVLFGTVQNVSWDMGFRLLLLMFAAIILGGLGSAYGAIVGSFVVGIAAHLSTLWFPVELQNAWALLLLIVVLIVRPQGIMGRRERVG